MYSDVYRLKVGLIGLVTLIYSSLLVMAAGCALAHADRSQSHQHHHSEEGSSDQNLLCVWACQATADAVEPSWPSLAVTELVARPADLDSHRPCFLQPPSGTQTRAPPSISFIRLG